MSHVTVTQKQSKYRQARDKLITQLLTTQHELDQLVRDPRKGMHHHRTCLRAHMRNIRNKIKVLEEKMK